MVHKPCRFCGGPVSQIGMCESLSCEERRYDAFATAYTALVKAFGVQIIPGVGGKIVMLPMADTDVEERTRHLAKELYNETLGIV